MSVDAHTNFAYSNVATAPSPPTSGTSLTVTSGTGSIFPTPPFNATVWPAGAQPTTSNAEIVRVTAISTDTFTITRAQEGTTARSITVGDQIAATITAKTLTDAEKSFGVSTGGNTSGSTGVLFGPQVVLAGGNNITLSQSTDASSRITVSISGPTPTATAWYPFNQVASVAGQQGQATLHIAPTPAPMMSPGEAQIDRIAFPIYFSNASNSTGSATLSLWFGLYTKTQSTLSLWGSTSRTEEITWSGNDASSASKRGIKLFTIGWTTSIPFNEYYAGVISRTTTGGGNASLSQLLVSQIASSYSGILNAATNASQQISLGLGAYSASTTAFPNSIPFSDLRGNSSAFRRPPTWFAISGTI